MKRQHEKTGAENTPTLDEHHLPARRVPTPAPVAWLPPTPRDSANPITNVPPMDNPGGVNGDRPAREVPGLHAA